MSTLSSSKILVTGAAGGIGAAVVTHLESLGATVVGTDICAANGVVECDLTERDSIRNLISRISGEGSLTGLVHCAAKCGTSGPFEDISIGEWNAYIDANVTGAFNVCQAVAARMIRDSIGGRIVMVGSINAISSERNNSPYVVSKGATRMLAKSMAVELGRYGIAVNSIHPGAIITPRNQHVMQSAPFESLMSHHVPMQRAGVPEEVARIAAFLVHPLTSYVTGAEILVDGGLKAQHLGPMSD